jgi:hypothetical protein
MPEKAGEIYHIRRDRNEQCDQESLVFCDIIEPVNAIYKRDEKNSEKARQQTGYEIETPKCCKHSCGNVIQKRPMITGIIHPCSLGEELIGEPGMNCFIMVEQLKIELPEPDEDGADQDQEKNPFKRKYFFDGMGESRGLLHAAPSTL